MNIRIQKHLIKFKSFFILNSKKRKRYRRFQMHKISKQYNANIKWGVSYSVFDGEELLEASIKSIRNQVDYVNVVYQTKSWYGNEASPDLLSILYKLKNEGLIDELIEYVPNYSLPAGVQEKEKRNLGLKHAINSNVNYFMTMDCDEFYEENDMIEAKEFILENKITNSYCLQYKYLEKPTKRNINFVGYVGFFFKINKDSYIGEDSDKPCIIDPTRVVVYEDTKRYFVLRHLKMHHMELVRKDLNKKVINSSFGKKIEIPDFSNTTYNIVKVPNIFNIEIGV
ncbi:MAG: hypothetical protein ACI4S3_02215 [Candidatus Gastranaerophilaceae bacterium]